eukprot:gnl/Hemi2/1929_TR687_c0_g1_i1.p1 gnl/Hemi2/1929_TR687_c0_g1~~gnl/Hemi2/1929_TR687_c0_g1_i1.p1  ORF type:complete len:543 (-),score=161.20 gnl/Hemi2/1929_TR687_c0_g1_i1:91-1650(-)
MQAQLADLEQRLLALQQHPASNQPTTPPQPADPQPRQPVARHAAKIEVLRPETQFPQSDDEPTAFPASASEGSGAEQSLEAVLQQAISGLPPPSQLLADPNSQRLLAGYQQQQQSSISPEQQQQQGPFSPQQQQQQQQQPQTPVPPQHATVLDVPLCLIEKFMQVRIKVMARNQCLLSGHQLDDAMLAALNISLNLRLPMSVVLNVQSGRQLCDIVMTVKEVLLEMAETGTDQWAKGCVGNVDVTTLLSLVALIDESSFSSDSQPKPQPPPSAPVGQPPQWIELLHEVLGAPLCLLERYLEVSARQSSSCDDIQLLSALPTAAEVSLLRVLRVRLASAREVCQFVVNMKQVLFELQAGTLDMSNCRAAGFPATVTSGPPTTPPPMAQLQQAATTQTPPAPQRLTISARAELASARTDSSSSSSAEAAAASAKLIDKDKDPSIWRGDWWSEFWPEWCANTCKSNLVEDVHIGGSTNGLPPDILVTLLKEVEFEKFNPSPDWYKEFWPSWCGSFCRKKKKK